MSDEKSEAQDQSADTVPLEKQVGILQEELNRLQAAIHTTHDHLHHNRVDEAHRTLENAMDGEEVSPPHISLNEAAKVQRFISSFNNLATAHEVLAATIALVPSDEDPRKVSIQLGGATPAVAIVQEAFGRHSTMAGQHGDGPPQSGERTEGGIIIP